MDTKVPDSLVSFFDKLITDFSWRRLAAVLIVAALGFAGLWVYEVETGSFNLSRLEKQISLLERLAKLRADPILANKELGDIYEQLREQLANSATPSNSSISLSQTALQALALSPGAKQALAAAAAWGILALLLVVTRSFELSAFFGMLVIAIPSIVVAALLPSFQASWINYLAYPIGHVVFLVSAIVLWQRRRRKAT